MRVPRFIKESRKKEQVGHRPLLPAALSFLGQKGDLVVSARRRPRPFPLFPWRERDVERVSSSEEEEEKQKEEDDVAGCDFRFLLDN